MKRYVLLFIAINVTSLYAILGGIGLNVVQDSFTLDAETFTNATLSSTNITRTEMSEPIGFGGFAYLTLIPFVDFEVGANFTGETYDYSFTPPLGGGELKKTLGIGKFAWHISAQRPLLKLPMIRIYAGGGFSGFQYTKIVTKDSVEGLEIECFQDIDCMEEKFSQNITGMHVEAGARLKPPILPFSLNVNARYNLVEDIAPNEDGFLTLSIGVAFAI